MNSRSFNCTKLFNPHFVGVIVFMLLNYSVFVFEYMLAVKPPVYQGLLIAFHALFGMLVWSMVQAITSDPGRVPIYWGFFAEENDTKKRRYCLLCHSFKPERCHHCSSCQRCVLNMDHHCPWISNCVGFHNRKFFMLFLLYIILTLVFCLCNQVPMLLKESISIIEGEQQFAIHTILRGLALITQLVFLVAIGMFFRFHADLVLTNSSTLDNLERQRNPNAGPNVYDIGTYQNFQQVFGSKCWLWPFPLESTTSNGVSWAKNQ